MCSLTAACIESIVSASLQRQQNKDMELEVLSIDTASLQLAKQQWGTGAAAERLYYKTGELCRVSSSNLHLLTTVHVSCRLYYSLVLYASPGGS